MDQSLSDAFQSGSGMDPSTLKAAILVFVGSVLVLLMTWIITRMFHEWENKQISSGEMIVGIVKLAGIVAFILLFIGMF
jgi:integrating conjugative element protein (TIGR03758 family)